MRVRILDDRQVFKYLFAVYKYFKVHAMLFPDCLDYVFHSGDASKIKKKIHSDPSMISCWENLQYCQVFEYLFASKLCYVNKCFCLAGWGDKHQEGAF